MNPPGIDNTGLSSLNTNIATRMEIIPKTNTIAPGALAVMASMMDRIMQSTPRPSSAETSHKAPVPSEVDIEFKSQPENEMEKPNAPAPAHGRKIPMRIMTLPRIPTPAPAADPLLTGGCGAICCMG